VPAKDAIANHEHVVVVGAEHGRAVLLQEWSLAGWDAEDKNCFRAFVLADRRCDDRWPDGEWRIAKDVCSDIRLTFHPVVRPPSDRARLPANPVVGIWWNAPPQS
jgi:hypothetical protein